MTLEERKQLIQKAEHGSEQDRLAAQLAAERELDERTDVTWDDIDDDRVRCSHRRIVESSGRVSKCSESAILMKKRLRSPTFTWTTIVGAFCAGHAEEHGYTP